MYCSACGACILYSVTVHFCIHSLSGLTCHMHCMSCHMLGTVWVGMWICKTCTHCLSAISVCYAFYLSSFGLQLMCLLIVSKFLFSVRFPNMAVCNFCTSTLLVHNSTCPLITSLVFYSDTSLHYFTCHSFIIYAIYELFF